MLQSYPIFHINNDKILRNDRTILMKFVKIIEAANQPTV